jgi:hydroxymethylpyrimidine pyrophosphatase-like HAD family hydrolase
MSTQPTSCGETTLPAIPSKQHIKASSWQSLMTAEAATVSIPPADSAELARNTVVADRQYVPNALPAVLLESEEDFYGQYSWCLNAFPTLQAMAEHLALELKKLGRFSGWQHSEIVTNIFLLSCAITDTVDDYLLGSAFDFSKLVRVLPIAGPGVRIVHKLLDCGSRLRLALLHKIRRWRDAWADEVTDFLQHAVVSPSISSSTLDQRDRLLVLLPGSFARNLGALRPKVPAFFRSRDFATHDCLELARKLLANFPNSDRSAIVVGLRTAGSFLAPLVCAYLRSHGQGASWIAIRPGKGLAAWEKKKLELASRRHSRAIITDESVHSGQTLAKSIGLLRKAGFAEEDILVLNPVEPALPDWRTSRLFQSLSRIHVITLEPRERYKYRALESKDAVQRLLGEYFEAHKYSDVRILSSSETEKLNSQWRDKPPERVDQRLKRVYEVNLKDVAGATEVRYVIAKSVGWGWLAYHAFIAGRRLAGLIPPILGMRDGILYSEWRPQSEADPATGSNREAMIQSLASYVAARTRNLRLNDNPVPDLANEDRHKGLELLANHLSRAYGSRIVAATKRSQLRRDLARNNTFAPVMTDSKMSPDEWILADDKTLKVDFEHHCFGKNEGGITDPAFDLASAIFHFELSEKESERLIGRYIEESGDTKVEERLFFNKLLASMRAQSLADHDLNHPRLLSQRSAANRCYISAWNFLVGETARECGKLCVRPEKVQWHAPLVSADIDGVLDRMVFGFPCTTAAGIRAISLLHAHGFCIAVNTARTLREVKQYCRSYGFAGGVAEYGAVLWDSVCGRERNLVDTESLEQLHRVRHAFRQVPGCFLNDDYLYSLRVFTYQNSRTAPVPALLAQDLLAGLSADRLTVHHTGLDTAILAKGVDKGSGLISLLDFVGLPGVEVVAVGDSEPDLAMFRVANRSFAPGNVTCRSEAQQLTCSIADSSYQPGLLEIAKRIVHPTGGSCDRCRDIEANWPKDKNLFVSLLEAADQRPLSLLLRNFHPSSFLSPFKK